MNHRERISAVLAGEPVDRLPVSVWGHDFLREWTAQDLARQTIERQQAHDYDFVKINPRWTLFAEPWGNMYQPPTEQKFPRLVTRIVEQADDLGQIPVVASDHAVLREHVEAVRLVTSEISQEVDCLATLFSPLAVLGLLSGGVGKPLTGFLMEAPELAHQALTHITQTLAQHAQELVEAGASGVFFAPLQWTSLEVCSADLYAEFGERYDREVLNAVSDARFNMLHICGSDIGIERFYDYPVPVLNWDNFDELNPSLAAVANESGKVVAGGVPHKRFHKLDAERLHTEVVQALGGLRTNLMLAGGCGIGALVESEPRDNVVKVANNLDL